ncbi:MAG: hypothetical protein WC969_11120 [Elusimicrobiota bacterium]|jgi:hypothetical protein
MNAFSLPSLLLACAVLAQDAPPPKPADPIPPAIAAAAQLTAPEGWDAEVGPEGEKDPSVTFTKGGDRIRVTLFGGPGTRFKTSQAFLRSPAATTMGRPAQKDAVVKVAGARAYVYRHAYPEPSGDPHQRSEKAPRMVMEEFCIVPAGKAFFVLSYAEEGVPDPSAPSRPSWEAFLKSFKLKK